MQIIKKLFILSPRPKILVLLVNFLHSLKFVAKLHHPK